MTALFGFLTALATLALWYFQRTRSPTAGQRQTDLADEYATLASWLAQARRRGDDAGADALLRRLRARSAPAQHPGHPGGQCDPGDAPGGDPPGLPGA